MSALVMVGFLGFFFASLVVGIRLIGVWRRSGELPPLLIAIGVLGIGPVGFGAILGSALLAESRPSLSAAAALLGFVASFAGTLAKYVFNWRVYHPSSRVARAVVMAAFGFVAGVLVYRAAGPGFAAGPSSDPLQLSQNLVQIGALMWGSALALGYYVRMRKRAALGLGDPVVANRFLLWGIGAGAASSGMAIGVVGSLATGLHIAEIPWVVAMASAFGLTAAVAMSLAFIPPAAYLRWVERTADAR
jgi:hypothetical protein